MYILDLNTPLVLSGLKGNMYEMCVIIHGVWEDCKIIIVK